jgi:hypothetical protein
MIEIPELLKRRCGKLARRFGTCYVYVIRRIVGVLQVLEDITIGQC